MSIDIIDGHQHFWALDSGLYGWLTPQSGALYRDYQPAELAPILQRCGVAGTILVQAADSEAELAALADYAARSGFVRGIVAPLQIDHPSAAGRIARAEEMVRLVGYRPPIFAIIAANGRVVEESAPALAEMSKQALSLDCLVRGGALAALPALARAFPDLHLVVNHGGAPDLSGSAPQSDWVQAMAELARQPATFCKVSGFFTLLPDGHSRRIVAAHIDILLDLFGADRLLWGSDWPVLNRGAEYGDWLTYCQDHLARLPDADQRAVFGGTAGRAYRLPDSPSPD